jgi:hypothetical protein
MSGTSDISLEIEGLTNDQADLLMQHLLRLFDVLNIKGAQVNIWDVPSVEEEEE